MGIHSPATELLALLQPVSRGDMFRNGAEHADRMAYEYEGDALVEPKPERRAYLLKQAEQCRERAAFYRSRMEIFQ